MGKPSGGKGRGRGQAGPEAWDKQQRSDHLKTLREREAGREVFLRPLPLEATAEDVQEIVARKSGEDGLAVDRVKLVKTGGGSLLSAFVTMSSEEDALRCTSLLNGAKFRGQVLAASLARNREGAGRVKEPCMFFLEGKCSRGESCQFLHERKASSQATAGSGRRLPPCRFFASGGCSRGESCKFSHERRDDEDALDGDAPEIQNARAADASGQEVDRPKEKKKKKQTEAAAAEAANSESNNEQVASTEATAAKKKKRPKGSAKAELEEEETAAAEVKKPKKSKTTKSREGEVEEVRPALQRDVEADATARVKKKKKAKTKLEDAEQQESEVQKKPKRKGKETVNASPLKKKVVKKKKAKLKP